ncbi:helix-turn-helix domain-containing protein [Stenotrophomonas rhizophila]|jgi:predicted DNA-binding mobile mystery protein A|uniref:helix-turn-helix domain-containing protein n=1 Tax=Stenotrophomonas rhizophila TaxID=216778 RepID=UPI000B87A62A|nr:helix-turn-helix domain-containing protein [Stenotrophomonas rhizophila]
MSSKDGSQMRRLARARLDEVGSRLRDMLPKLPRTPGGGWIAGTREALGMSKSDLARRLGVSPAAVAKLESNERAGTVQIDTLRRAATALDCELVVLVVPRQPLQAAVDQRRLQLYSTEIDRASVHMNLEDQAVSETLRRHLLLQAEAAIPDSMLWRELPIG